MYVAEVQLKPFTHFSSKSI